MSVPPRWGQRNDSTRLGDLVNLLGLLAGAWVTQRQLTKKSTLAWVMAHRSHIPGAPLEFPGSSAGQKVYVLS